MNFLIQTIKGEIVHDFSFILIDAIRYSNWSISGDKHSYLLTDSINNNPKDYIPIGSVEFVITYLEEHFGFIPKPQNIPEELLIKEFLKRKVEYLSKEKIQIGKNKMFVKSADKIKKFADIVSHESDIPEGNCMVSELIDIVSEWRAFIYREKLVGLQNYSGDFTVFPNVPLIKKMISEYKNAPVAYTLDVGINSKDGTFIIEVHDFFSCGLYGFADLKILPNMFINWFNEYILKNMEISK